MTRLTIPLPVVGVAATALAEIHTHGALENAFFAAGAPGPIPEGSKPVNARIWLPQANDDPTVQPLAVLGALLSEVYEVDGPENFRSSHREQVERRRRLDDVLTRVGLRYERPGRIVQVARTHAARGMRDHLAAFRFFLPPPRDGAGRTVQPRS
jgi:hypothetical protein